MLFPFLSVYRIEIPLFKRY